MRPQLWNGVAIGVPSCAGSPIPCQTPPREAGRASCKPGKILPSYAVEDGKFDNFSRTFRSGRAPDEGLPAASASTAKPPADPDPRRPRKTVRSAALPRSRSSACATASARSSAAATVVKRRRGARTCEDQRGVLRLQLQLSRVALSQNRWTAAPAARWSSIPAGGRSATIAKCAAHRSPGMKSSCRRGA